MLILILVYVSLSNMRGLPLLALRSVIDTNGGPRGFQQKTFKIDTQCIGATEQHAGIKEMATTADVQLRKDSLHLRCRITEETRNELALMKDDKI